MDQPKMTFQVDTVAPGRRLELRHENVRKCGTVYNTLGSGTRLTGTLRFNV
jgi:hypothetical protein